MSSEDQAEVQGFLEFCPACRRKHVMTMQPCPACNGRGGWVPMPKSERVQDICSAHYECEGCEAYKEHLG